MDGSDFDYLSGQISELLDRVNDLEKQMRTAFALFKLPIGSWIEVRSSENPFFNYGDRGKIVDIESDGVLLVDFSEFQGERKYKGGIWQVYPSPSFKIKRLEDPNE